MCDDTPVSAPTCAPSAPSDSPPRATCVSTNGLTSVVNSSAICVRQASPDDVRPS
ncbi:hypothetical protein BIW11_14197, partial [Tropilaelaps mercedesae]